MDLPSPPALLAALTAFVRGRLGSVPPPTGLPPLVIVTASAPFALTGYARARLLRQAHAGGLLREPPTGATNGVVAVRQAS